MLRGYGVDVLDNTRDREAATRKPAGDIDLLAHILKSDVGRSIPVSGKDRARAAIFAIDVPVTTCPAFSPMAALRALACVNGWPWSQTALAAGPLAPAGIRAGAGGVRVHGGRS